MGNKKEQKDQRRKENKLLLVFIVLYKAIEITERLFKMKSTLFQALKTVNNQDTSLKDIMIINIISRNYMTLQEIYGEIRVVIKSGHNCSVFLSGFD